LRLETEGRAPDESAREVLDHVAGVRA
jgi:hypothetical protein